VRDNRSNDAPDSNGNEKDNGFDESQVDPTLMAKLKRMKGASKCGQGRQKYSRRAKPKAEEMMEIYSESQRLLRDSRVSLPYHQPQPKLLDDFLARAAQKKQVYAGLQKARDIQKARVISDRLSISPTLLTSDKHRAKCAFVQCEPLGSTAETSPNCQLKTQNNKHSSVPVSSFEGISKCKALPVEKSGTDIVGNEQNELPDLCLVSASCEPTGYLSGQKLDMKSAEKHHADTVVLTDDISHTNSNYAPLLRKDPSRDLFKSQNSMIDENERPQNIMTEENERPQNSMTEGSEQPQNSMTEESEQPQNSMTEESEQSQSGRQVHICGTADFNCTVENNIRDGHFSCMCLDAGDSATVHETVSDSSTIATPLSRASRRKLLDRLQGVSLAASPSLSATPDGIICLDDAEPVSVVKDAGLLKLMNRLVTHSMKTSATPVAGRYGLYIVCHNSSLSSDLVATTHHVISLVATTHRIISLVATTHHCYKLEQLKQQLGVGMKEKRIEARQRRYDQFALDNEQGFEEEEEEELELVGSDTDDEEEEVDDTRPSDSDDEEEAVEDAKSLDTGEDEGNDCHINMEADDSDDDDDDFALDNEQGFEEEEEEELELVGSDTDDDEEEVEDTRPSDTDDEEEAVEDAKSSDLMMRMKTRMKKRNSHLSSSEEDCGEDIQICVDYCTSSDISKLLCRFRYFKIIVPYDRVPCVVSGLGQCSSQTSQLTSFLQDPTKQTDFRIENSESPDLYSTRIDDQNLHSRSQLSHSADTTSHLTESNLIKYLDDDGFIKISQTQQTSRVFLLPQTQTDGTADASKVFEGTSQMSAGHIFHGLATPASGRGEHHAVSSGQSSGTFMHCLITHQCHFSVCSTYRRRGHDHDDDDDVIDPFHVLSDSEDNVAQKSQK
ncbi:unnamed protein product, partial [Candidula unifasciata]